MISVSPVSDGVQVLLLIKVILGFIRVPSGAVRRTVSLIHMLTLISPPNHFLF